MTRERALEFATKAHAGQKRKDGKDYITHPIAVAEIAERMWWGKYAEDYHGSQDKADKIYIVAVNHDTIEDTEVTLRDFGKEFPDSEIIQAVSMLTRRKGQTYYDFIQNIALHGDLISLIVKIADLEHNMSDLQEGTLKDKYRFALKILQDALYSYRILH